MWITGPEPTPTVVLVGYSGWVRVCSFGDRGIDRTLATTPEPTSRSLMKVWGASPARFWTVDTNGTVWEFSDSDCRVVVRGLRRDGVEFRDAWVSPTGAVFASTEEHLYRLN